MPREIAVAVPAVWQSSLPLTPMDHSSFGTPRPHIVPTRTTRAPYVSLAGALANANCSSVQPANHGAFVIIRLAGRQLHSLHTRIESYETSIIESC